MGTIAVVVAVAVVVVAEVVRGARVEGVEVEAIVRCLWMSTRIAIAMCNCASIGDTTTYVRLLLLLL